MPLITSDKYLKMPAPLPHVVDKLREQLIKKHRLDYRDQGFYDIRSKRITSNASISMFKNDTAIMVIDEKTRKINVTKTLYEVFYSLENHYADGEMSYPEQNIIQALASIIAMNKMNKNARCKYGDHELGIIKINPDNSIYVPGYFGTYRLVSKDEAKAYYDINWGGKILVGTGKCYSTCLRYYVAAIPEGQTSNNCFQYALMMHDSNVLQIMENWMGDIYGDPFNWYIEKLLEDFPGLKFAIPEEDPIP